MKNLKVFVFLFFVVLFAGCQNQLQDIGKEAKQSELQEQANVFVIPTANGEVKLVNGRLVFANLDVYNKTVSEVLKMSQKQVETWEKSLGFSSLRAYNVSHIQNQRLADIPPCYTTLLNTKGEYQIGTLIYWMNTDGYAYFITDGDEKQLAKVQANPKNATVQKFPFGMTSLPSKGTANNQLITANVYIPPNGANAPYQYQYGYGGITYKMVFEIASYVQPFYAPYGWGYRNELFALVKLEYLKNNGTWASAGENAFKSISGYNYNVTASNGQNFVSYSFAGSRNDNQALFVRLHPAPIDNSSALSWNATVSGNFSESVSVHSQIYNVNPATW